MRLAREFLLIIFAMMLVLVLPVLADLLNMSNWGELSAVFTNNPLIIVLLAIPILSLVFVMVFIHKIDKWETKEQDAKDDKRNSKLIKAIKANSSLLRASIDDIRQERNEQNKPKQQP